MAKTVIDDYMMCFMYIGYLSFKLFSLRTNLYTAKTPVLNMQHRAGVKPVVLIFSVKFTPLGVTTLGVNTNI